MADTDRIAHPWGTRTPYGPGTPWPVRVDTSLEGGLTEAEVDRWVPSATILHSNGDGLDIAVKDGRIAGVRGAPATGSTMGGWARRTCSAAPDEDHAVRRAGVHPVPLRVRNEPRGLPSRAGQDPPDPRQEGLFLVVQDIFLTETAQLADVVLPAAAWGEKTGTFTNADRTVHLSEKAVDPPGEARPDLDIFLDYARRLDRRDKDGAPLVPWSDAEGAFEAWKRCSAGRPCDYSGMSYAMLRGGGVQWPCDAEHPDGAERLYGDGRFFSDPRYCESYGHDLTTGAPLEPDEYISMNPSAKAVIKAAEYLPPHEPPRAELPFALITGRTLYHFHTRTKTGRVPRLNDAAPEVWVEMSPADARERGWAEGDFVRVTTPRGHVEARLRIGGVRPGVLFLPFHYGYWDCAPEDGHHRAANELTITDWDPAPAREPTPRARDAA